MILSVWYIGVQIVGRSSCHDQNIIVTGPRTWKAPHGMNPALYKVFEKYNLGDKAMLCLWVNGQLNTAIRERSRVLELQDRLREWLQEL